MNRRTLTDVVSKREIYNSEVERDKKRLLRNQKARERHWRNTGVSQSTINWMKQTGKL